MAEARATKADGYRIAYEVSGEGPTVLLLPGFMSDRRRWHETGYVDRITAAGYQVIAVDPLGHGDSDKPHEPEAYSVRRLAAHSRAVLDAEEVESAIVWGYSRGCRLLAALMQHEPERVGTAIAGGLDLAILAGGGALDLSSAASHLHRGDWEGFWNVFPLPMPAEVKDLMTRRNDPRALAALMMAPQDVTADPTKFHGMLYVGDGEPFAASTAEIASVLGIRCEILPTGGHAETFLASGPVCDVVLPFLAEM
jgi:pimeloyl-ACP methyl ester carboxylesterase